MTRSSLLRILMRMAQGIYCAEAKRQKQHTARSRIIQKMLRRDPRLIKRLAAMNPIGRPHYSCPRRSRYAR